MMLQRVLAATASALLASSTSADPVRITVDPAVRHQTIEGFGASGCWTAQRADDWPAETRQRVVDLLFTDAGAGLSIWRYNIGAGGGEEIGDPNRRTKSVEVAPRTRQYDLSRDRAAIGLMHSARDAGVSRFILFANSAPPHMTVSGRVSGGENGTPNLRDDQVDAFADYLVDISILMRDELNLNDIRLSPMNEPQWDWGRPGNQRQEACNMLPGQMATLYHAVATRLQARAPQILMEGPEGGEWKGTTFDYIAAFKDDAVVMNQLGSIAIHSYWSNDDDRRAFMKRYRDAGLTHSLNQSEFCQMEHGKHDGMDGAFVLFDVMHADLTICKVVSWSWWLALSYSDYADGLLYINADHELTTSKRLFVMGHFSRFLKPGAVRIDAVTQDDRLRATAYLSANGSEIVTVIGNRSNDAIDFSLSIPNAAAASKGFITDATRDVAAFDATLTKVSMPPRSIATVITPITSTAAPAH